MISDILAFYVDLRLISDLITVIVGAASGAIISSLLGQPVSTGYLVAGSCVGPGGMGLVIELVQVNISCVNLFFCLIDKIPSAGRDLGLVWSHIPPIYAWTRALLLQVALCSSSFACGR